MNPRSGHKPLLSIVVPTFNEEDNIPSLLEHLFQLEQVLPGADIEFIFVDDHSQDNTFERLKQFAAQKPNLKVLRLARNSGSHAAIIAGISKSRGDCIVYLAADLQNPPSLIQEMFDQWLAGYKIIWATRQSEKGRPAKDRFFSWLYWRFVNFCSPEVLPAGGMDFAMFDGQVKEAIRTQFHRAVPIYLLIGETGMRSTVVYFHKPMRKRGKSGWSLGKKLVLVVETAVSISYVPVRMVSFLGMGIACLGALYALFIIANALLHGSPAEGWPTLMVAILVLGGIQIMMLGFIGEYLYLALKEIRNPPRFVIEDTVNIEADQCLKAPDSVMAP